MTLLEVLVVIAIMAIVLGLANFSFQGGGQRQARISAEKLTAQINHASLLATLRGRSMGLALADQDYQFLQQAEIADSARGWIPATQRGLQRVNSLPHGGYLRLILDSTMVTLPAAAPPTPQLQFDPSGELSDFKILIDDTDGNPGYSVAADPERFQATLTTGTDHQ